MAASILMVACTEKAKIRIQNNVSSVRMNDIRWGDISIGGNLLPGQTTKEITILKRNESLPKSFSVSFILEANDQEVFLTTEEEYLLDLYDDITIVINDDTPVFNP